MFELYNQFHACCDTFFNSFRSFPQGSLAQYLSLSWMLFLRVSSTAKVKLLAELFERFELLKAEESGWWDGGAEMYETIHLILIRCCLSKFYFIFCCIWLIPYWISLFYHLQLDAMHHTRPVESWAPRSSSCQKRHLSSLKQQRHCF